MAQEKGFVVSSTQADDFTDAIATNGSESETLEGWRADGRGSIEIIRIKSREQKAWRLEFLDSNSNILRDHSFSEADGKVSTISGVNWYFYFKKISWPNPKLPYTYTLTAKIINLSTGAKTATSGDTGALILILEGRK